MSPEITLRSAREADIPGMMEISLSGDTAARWTAQQWVDIFDPQSPPRLVLVAERPGTLPKICGFLVAQLPPVGLAEGDCELENIAVDPIMRRRGLGLRLLQELLNRAQIQRSAHVMLEVRRSNETAIALYRSCGFGIAGTRRKYYQNPDEDALIMQWPLPPAAMT
ncbi:MAG: ribosomal protein S18-alanine N-acetyltransferase [Acidobacteriota bacterium]|nr:ribosomal protein S18-alanine N-acetyltransferase [Acidobacteriota bacterium]